MQLRMSAYQTPQINKLKASANSERASRQHTFFGTSRCHRLTKPYRHPMILCDPEMGTGIYGLLMLDGSRGTCGT